MGASASNLSFERLSCFAADWETHQSSRHLWRLWCAALAARLITPPPPCYGSAVDGAGIATTPINNSNLYWEAGSSEGQLWVWTGNLCFDLWGRYRGAAARLGAPGRDPKPPERLSSPPGRGRGEEEQVAVTPDNSALMCRDVEGERGRWGGGGLRKPKGRPGTHTPPR